MNKQLCLTAMFAGSLLLAGCGGGGGSNDATPTTTKTAARVQVAGPLDAAQAPVSGLLFSQLAAATATTPLNPVVVCGNQIVTYDTLDIVDAIAVGLQTAAATQNPAVVAGVAPQIQTQLTQLAADLQALLGSLAGGAGCSLTNIGTGTTGVPTSNPLAGTPLAPLGAALLPVLTQIQTQTGGSGQDAQLSTLATTVSLLATAFKNGLALIPAEAKTAPIAGGALTTVGTALTDVSTLLNAALAYNGPATQTALNTTLNHTLSNVLTQVVPVSFLETQAGMPGVYSSQINTAVATASTQLANGLGTVITPVLETGLRDSLAPALNPIENQVLPALLGPLNCAIAAYNTGTGSLPTSCLTTGSSPGLPTTALPAPLASLVGTLTGLLGGSLPAAGSCPVAGTPLSALCALFSALP